MYTPAQILRGLRNPSLARDHVLRRASRPVFDRLNGPNDGVYVVEEDWDNLVILDACRYDVFAEINDLDGDLECRTSRGSATPQFLRENFVGRELHDTVFLSANAVVGQHADELDLHRLVGLWGESEAIAGATLDEDNNVHPRSLVDPEPVVEHGLRLQEAHPHKRLVVHFLQPHTPFVVKDGERLPPDSKYRTFTAARRGEVSATEMRAVYAENVAYVLDYVAELLDGWRGKTVVTADHGELLGETIHPLYRLLHPRWSLREQGNFRYAHYNDVRVPELVRVPWLTVERGERREIRAAEETAGVEIDADAIASQLEALGYR